MNVEKIWAEYQTSLKAFLLKNVNNPDDVEDLLQEILIKTYQNLSNVKELSHLKAWLFQIAQRTIIDFYRQQGKAQKLQNEPLWYAQEQEDIHQQLARCILPFINGLAPKDKQLLNAIEIEGISQKNYALQHNIKYSTLKSQVKRAVKHYNSCFSSVATSHLINRVI